MGDFADDLSMDYSGEAYSQMSKSERKAYDLSQTILPNSPSNVKHFRISIVDSQMNVEWSDVVIANSNKGARDKFRNDYKDIRMKYLSIGGYMLQVKNI